MIESVTTPALPTPTPPVSSIIDPMMAINHPLRILIAEDDVLNQMVTIRILKRMGYMAEVVNNGTEALAQLRHQAYDVILMDIGMPGMDGLEATHHIRRMSIATQPYIVALVTQALARNPEHVLASGVDDCVCKPLQVSELVRALLCAPSHDCNSSPSSL